MKSDVYFISSRAISHASPAKRFEKLIDAIGLDQFAANKSVAVKLHFGEEGATGYIHPSYVRVLVNRLKNQKTKPFLTDTNTLYHGYRSNGIDHLELAIRNGFTYSVVGAPLVIADGIHSRSVKEISSGPHHFKKVKIGNAIWEANGLISMNHFKGHLLTGFGGAIKNLSMGCGSRATKQRMHADMKPEIKKAERCIACGECVPVCPVEAITVSENLAHFNLDKCIGCAECLSACRQSAISIQWSGSSQTVQEKMAEVALSVVSQFHTPCLHFNFLLNVTPECDCLSWTDNPIIQDIGILASLDPVAIDQASLDFVKKVPGLPNSVLPPHTGENVEKFELVHPGIRPEIQLEYGESIGLGSRKYVLHEVN